MVYPSWLPKVQAHGLDLHPRPPIIDTDPRQARLDAERMSSLQQQGSWRWTSLMMLVIGLLVVVRLVDLQIVNGHRYRQRAEYNRLRLEYVPAARGSIVDRHGQVLADNVPNFTLTVTPADLPMTTADRRLALTRLSELTKVPLATIEEKLATVSARAADPVVILDHLPAAGALQWMVQTSSWTWVSIDGRPTRQYPFGLALSPILGYVGPVTTDELRQDPQLRPTMLTGKAGLERIHNQQLSGTDGQRAIERDVLNQRHHVLQEQPPVTGETLVLTVDAKLQQQLFDRLAEAVRLSRGSGGGAVAIDPKTGQVLALVSYPTFDNNWFVTANHGNEIRGALADPHRPFLNRAISGQYPSGSIIKPLIAAAGLAEDLITPTTTVMSSGGLPVGTDFFPDWKAGGHGATNLTKAIAESVNTYFYYLAGGYEQHPGLGVDLIVTYLQRFGWGSRLDIDLPGEAAGLLPTREWRANVRATPWRLGDTYHLAIGQGDLLVTPLQVAVAVAAIANDGVLYQPQLVQAVVKSANQSVRRFKPAVIRRLNLPPSTLSVVRRAMREGVLSGSSQALQTLSVNAAGKTGTAEFGNAGKTHAWYTVFAPYEDPQIVLAVVIEGGGEGHQSALPVAQRVLDWYFSADR
ncbi:MAG: penicillin-binding protein 2 [Candidatus Kerfeldbacteria bacterium]|nr:penicillin-binding protein 2 [Candidatus Kerfeldbacteria bacterium]